MRRKSALPAALALLRLAFPPSAHTAGGANGAAIFAAAGRVVESGVSIAVIREAGAMPFASRLYHSAIRLKRIDE